jgi:CRP/FNR family transcriptional regulator
VSLDGNDLDAMGELIKHRAPLKSGEYVYHTGDKFHSLFAIKAGAVKTYGLTTDGREQITGFHMAGELVGMDAIGTEAYACNAVALDHTELCELPFEHLESIGQQMPRLQHELSCLMSREIRDESRMLITIGRMTAEQRVACFLLNIYHRMRLRGGEIDSVQLPMSREDIGNYLGLTLETVSRRLGDLQGQGVIELHKRQVKYLDMARLGQLCTS